MITETEHIGVETHLALLHLENCTVDKNQSNCVPTNLGKVA